MSNNKWNLVDWDGNPSLGLKCWRKRFKRGHVSVGAGEWLSIVHSFGPDSEDSFCSTRWRKDGNHLTEQEAMRLVDAQKGHHGP